MPSLMSDTVSGVAKGGPGRACARPTIKILS